MKRTYLIPATVFVILAMTLLWIQQINETNRANNNRFSVAMVAEQLAVRLETFIATRLLVGEHLRHEWADGKINTQIDYESEALSFKEIFPDFQAISWVNREGIIKWVTPKKGNMGAIGLDLLNHPVAGDLVRRATKSGKIKVTPPINLAQGGKGISAYLPLGKDKLEGYVNLVFRVDPLVKKALGENHTTGFLYQILDDGKLVYSHGQVHPDNPLIVQRKLKVANRVWTIDVMPTAEGFSYLTSLTSKLALVLALLTSACLSWLLWLFLRHQETLTENSRILEATLGNLDDGITMVDADMRLVASNQRFMDLQNFQPDTIKLGDSYESIVRYLAGRGDYGPGDVEEQVRKRVELAKKFEPHLFERILPDGTVMEIRGMPLPEGGFVTRYTDITKRKQAERELQQSEERFSKAFNASPAAISISGIEDGILLDVNQHWCEATGYERIEVIGNSVADFGLWQNLKQRAQLVKILTRDRVVRNFECTLMNKKNKPMECVFNGEIIELDNVERLLLVFHDVTERKKAEQAALHMAGHDPLTGLPNRNLLRDRLEQEITRAKRNETIRPFLSGGLLHWRSHIE